MGVGEAENVGEMDARAPLMGEGRGGGLGVEEMPGGNVPACTPLPDPPPQGGREKDLPVNSPVPHDLDPRPQEGKEPAAPPVNSPVPQAPVVRIAGINRIYLEQEKLPKRPGTIR